MVLLSLQIKYKITGRREGDVASCYANPALAERELGWKAAFGLDKMCKSIPFPSTLCVAGCPSPGPPLTAAFSLLQARTCGGGSCRIPQASARTEPWPEGSPGCQGRLGASPTCLPARLRSSWVQFQLPLLPLTWGRKAGASPASPLLILIPPPRSFASHRAETQGRTEPGPGFSTWGTKYPHGPAGRRCLAGSCGHCGSCCSWTLPVPWEVAASSAHTCD